MGIKQATYTSFDLKKEALDEQARQKLEAIEELKTKEFNIARKVAKKDWIKTSYWMPEHTPAEVDKSTDAPSSKLVCPWSTKQSSTVSKESEGHYVKLKDLVRLNLSQDEKEQFVCQVCAKKLGH